MKKARFTTKALLSLIIVVVLIGSLSISSFAADKFTNANMSYGEIVPTDSALEAQKQSYTIYGDSAELYFMQISKGKANAHFCIEIFNDSSYQNQIQRYAAAYSVTAGNKAIKLTWNLKNLASGAYYGRCYSYIESGEDILIDSASMKTFVLNIDRLSKREVPLVSLINTATGPRITWEAVPTAKQYNVYRRAAGETGWKFLYTEKNGGTSYTDTTAVSGKYYAYTVKCSDGKYVSLYNTAGLNGLYLGIPVISVNGGGSAGYATIKWNKIAGAAGYYVYRKGGSLSDYTWKLIATIKSGDTVSYVDSAATSTDWKYTYTVKAYSGNYVSAYNYAGIDFDYIPAPTLTRAYNDETGMKVEWNSNNPNITKYFVYRKDGTSWKHIGTTTNKYFIDTTAVSNNTYTYTVKATSDTNMGAYNATGISAKYLKTPALEKLTFDAYYKSLVRWEKVPGAAGYKVYRRIGNATGWVLIATITDGSTTYYNDGCSKLSGVRYTYTVRAFDSQNLLSYFCVNGTSAVCLAKPNFTLTQFFDENDNTGVEMTWHAINGATKYNVYRRLPGGAWEELVLGVTETVYVDTTVETDVTYEYALRALTDEGDISYFYTYSIKPVERPLIESVTNSEEGSKVIWSAIEGADAYTVYRQAKGSDSWETVATVTEAEYLDASEEAKTQPFYYTVSATFGETESSTRDGVANFVEAEISAEYVPATDDSVAAIKVTVNYDEGAMAGIFRSTNEEEPIYLEGVTGSFNDTGIAEGDSYTYTLAVAMPGKLGNQVSATAKYPHPPLEKAIITSCEGNYNEGDPFIILTWEKVEFADEYIVCKTDGNGEWIEVEKVIADDESAEAYSFKDENVSSEIDYTYTVKAVATKSERDSSESETATCFIKTLLDKLTGIKFVAEKTEPLKVAVTISWDAVKYAEGYVIRRYLPGEDVNNDAAGYLVANISAEDELSYTDIARINREYTYKITAFSEERGTVKNTETFCWTEVPPVPTDEECLEIIDETTRIEDGYIITDKSFIDDLSDIANTKSEYYVQTQFETEYLGTGAVIEICMDGYTLKTYTLIVKGDVVADGVYDVLDFSELAKMVNGHTDDNSNVNLAADLNNDGIIDSDDLDILMEKL